MKAYLWCTNDGNASWTVNGRQAPRRIVLIILIIIILARTFIPQKLIHGSR